MTNQAKLKSFHSTSVYKFGLIVPHNHKEVMQLNKANSNNTQIDKYKASIDCGAKKYPHLYKEIKIHLVHDVKRNLMRKAQIVTNRHLETTPLQSVYSSVVSLQGLKACLFIAELNRMSIWTTGIGNAYLEAYTEEKIFILAGPYKAAILEEYLCMTFDYRKVF